MEAWAGQTSDDWWRKVKEVSPGSIRVLIHGEISDNPSLSTPELDAEATAQYLSDKPNAPRLIRLKNEPPIWNGANTRKQVTDYTVRWLRRGHELGLNAVVEQFNSGWPKVMLIDDEDWEPDFLAIDAAMNSGDYHGRHAYWGKDGPRAWWPWTTGRWMALPTTRNILISECGFDAWTDGPVEDRQKRGWKAWRTPDQYVQELIDFHKMVNADPRVKGTEVFSADFNSSEWASFDIYDIMPEIAARRAEFDMVDSSVQMPTRLHLPIEKHLGITARFGEKNQYTNYHLGLDFSAYTGTSVLAAADGVVDKVVDLGDKSYGLYVKINHYWGFTLYAHLSAVSVAKGDKVVAGQRIGFSGNSGYSFGGHLHFEVQPLTATSATGYRTDPALYLEGLQPVSTNPLALSSATADKMRNVAVNAIGATVPVPYNSTAAFPQKARALSLGAPLTKELDESGYRMQGYALGIVYAPIGQWGSIGVLPW